MLFKFHHGSNFITEKPNQSPEEAASQNKYITKFKHKIDQYNIEKGGICTIINNQLVAIYEVMDSTENVSENSTKKLSIYTLLWVKMA